MLHFSVQTVALEFASEVDESLSSTVLSVINPFSDSGVDSGIVSLNGNLCVPPVGVTLYYIYSTVLHDILEFNGIACKFLEFIFVD